MPGGPLTENAMLSKLRILKSSFGQKWFNTVKLTTVQHGSTRPHRASRPRCARYGRQKIRKHKRQEPGVLLVFVDLRLP
jgi:hypothetical protein